MEPCKKNKNICQNKLSQTFFPSLLDTGMERKLCGFLSLFWIQACRPVCEDLVSCHPQPNLIAHERAGIRPAHRQWAAGIVYERAGIRPAHRQWAADIVYERAGIRTAHRQWAASIVYERAGIRPAHRQWAAGIAHERAGIRPAHRQWAAGMSDLAPVSGRHHACP